MHPQIIEIEPLFQPTRFGGGCLSRPKHRLRLKTQCPSVPVSKHNRFHLTQHEQHFTLLQCNFTDEFLAVARRAMPDQSPLGKSQTPPKNPFSPKENHTLPRLNRHLILCRFLRFPLPGSMLQTSLFGFVLRGSNPASTTVGVECSFQMWEKLSMSTAKVRDTKIG